MKDTLVIVWLSVDKRAAIDMALLYARDSKISGWFSDVKLILWGPTVELVTKDKTILPQIEIMQNLKIEITACLSCARLYGVVNQLQAISIEAQPMGEKLTEFLKSEAAVIFI